jgi:hypothetical protein
LARRRAEKPYDPELWDFMSRIHGRFLESLTNDDLQARLNEIDLNIQYLDSEPTSRDSLPPERGWLSPWWWLRNRHWTLNEFGARGIEPQPTTSIEPMPKIDEPFVGACGGGRLLLFRISRIPYLQEMLTEGRLRFVCAQSYLDLEADRARQDDEMTKSYFRPGSAISIQSENGNRIEPIGDVTFSSSRTVTDNSIPVPYWMICFSSDLDPRLVSEFSAGQSDDAFLAIFDPKEFVRRLLKALRGFPRSRNDLAPVNYYDPWRAQTDLDAIFCKEMRFAHQREMRLVIDPELPAANTSESAFFIEVGSLEDIAGIYLPSGSKIDGAGPSSFIAA